MLSTAQTYCDATSFAGLVIIIPAYHIAPCNKDRDLQNYQMRGKLFLSAVATLYIGPATAQHVKLWREHANVTCDTTADDDIYVKVQ